jgi:hypothetical protein
MGDGYQHWCRLCFRDYFEARGDRHRAQSRAALRERKRRARAFITEYLRTHLCVDCGEGDLVVLDFDHLGHKLELVSALVHQGAPRARIEAEVARCEVRCANCHRRVTARRAGWSRLAGDIDDPRRGFSAPVRRNLHLVHSMLAAGRCVDCCEPDMLVLEFDHVGTKRGQISRMVWNVSLATLQAELAECEMRCCNCHRRITASRRARGGSRGSTLSVEPP